ncbi:MAG: AAA family ATPase [Euryarchaeota archaeon]|nr:AAA family ATPase [Euryarchaeota archaeon]
MKCPKCQFKNPDEMQFCGKCGHELSISSELPPKELSFEEKLKRIQRYLPKGLTEKVLAQKDKIEGERKQVTIMFCDMQGFTPLTEKLGPEDTFSLMDQVYEILIHKVHQYEGTVNELRGDGILALFGAPIALEDAPYQAIRASIAIHREIARFNEKQKSVRKIPPVFLRIGINSGAVVVGSVGNDLRVQFTAAGDTINMAARMEGLAEPGTTYVTEETFRLTKGLFRFEALGKKAVKGKAEAIPVYKVLSVKEDIYRPRLGSGRAIYSKMVGRDMELDRLELQVVKAINGEGSVVNIIGEAGIGKSRLVAELKKRDVMKRVTTLEGRAISIGRNLSFHPIIDFLKQWARIRADDGEATALGKLETAVRSIFPEDVYEVLPFVATLMGMSLSGRYAERVKGIEGEALEKLILKNVRDLLIRATELTPLVIVVEDLHWADTSTIDLMESLFRLVETRRILFVNVFRPGHKETGDWIVEKTRERLPAYYVEIVVEPLDERMSEALIDNMLNISGLHQALIGQIVHRSGGNPYFIEEVVQSFIDEGVVALKHGTFEVTEKIRTMAIPHTINDVLMSRIDRLEEETRNLLKIASVIGRNFFYRVLADVATTIEGIDSRLSYLKEIQIIRERRRMEEIEFLFRHALAQEAAYESILFHKRKDLHIKVAHSIERIFSHRLHAFYGMLAYHYSRGENLDKAEEYLIKAGEEALKSSASNEALYYYQEALGLYLKKYGDAVEPEKVAIMEKNIALALYNRGLLAESIEHFDNSLNYYWGKIPGKPITAIPKITSAILHFLITLYLPIFKFKKTPTQRDIEFIDLFQKKCKALAIIDPMRFFFEFLHMYKGVTKFDIRKFELGLEVFMGASSLLSFSGISFKLSRKILDSARGKVNKNNVNIFTFYDFLETIHNYFKGDWKAINEYDDDLVNKNLSMGKIWDASQHLYWHGLLKIYQGSLSIARSIVNRLKGINETYGNDFSLLLMFELNINLLIECRKLNDALSEIEKAIAFVQKAIFNIYLFDMYSYKVWVHILAGDMDEAENCLQQANRIRHGVNAVPIQLVGFYRNQLEFYLCRLKESIKEGNKSESFEYRKQVVKSYKMMLKVSQKAVQHRIESYRLTGKYYWLIKKQKKALIWWRRAIEEGEERGARLELSRAYFEIGKLLLEPESKYKMLNGITAKEYLEKAKVLFEEMDLQWDLDELSRVVRS